MRVPLVGKLIVSFVFVASFAFTSVALAEEAPPSDAPQDASSNTQMIEVASVNVYDAKISKQDGRSLEVTFQLANGKGVQPGVSYGLQLSRMVSSTNEEDAGLFLAPAKITLKENETLDKTFLLTIPDYLPGGNYAVRVVVGGPSGVLFGFNQAGIVGVPDATADRVELSDCMVWVGSEGATKSYTLAQGVDIAPSESLQLACQAKTYTNHSLEVSAQFSTFRHTLLSGQTADVRPSDGLKSFVLEPGVFQPIVISLPLARTPQAYDVQTFLSDTAGKRLSSSVTAHYVLRGASATFQNVLFDKAAYNQGDEAKVTYTWAGSADSFPDSRAGQGTDTGALNVNLTLKDAQGTPCAEPIRKAVDAKAIQETVSLAITRVCADPTLEASLIQEGGMVLDRANLETNSRPQPMFGNVKLSWKQRLGEYPWAYGSVIILGVLLLGALMWKLGRKGRGVAMVVLLASLVLLGGAGEANADTYSVYGQISSGHFFYTNFNAALGSSTVTAGSQIEVRGASSQAWCSNGVVSNSVSQTATSLDDGQSSGSHSKADVTGSPTEYKAFGQQWNWSSGSVNASSSAGSGKRVLFTGKMFPGTSDEKSGQVTLTYTAVAPVPVNNQPTGGFDGADCSNLVGWAYDPDVASSAISVHIYKDGPAGSGAFLTSVTASQYRSDLSSLGGGYHGFNGAPKSPGVSPWDGGARRLLRPLVLQ